MKPSNEDMKELVAIEKKDIFTKFITSVKETLANDGIKSPLDDITAFALLADTTIQGYGNSPNDEFQSLRDKLCLGEETLIYEYYAEQMYYYKESETLLVCVETDIETDDDNVVLLVGIIKVSKLKGELL